MKLVDGKPTFPKFKVVVNIFDSKVFNIVSRYDFNDIDKSVMIYSQNELDMLSTQLNLLNYDYSVENILENMGFDDSLRFNSKTELEEFINKQSVPDHLKLPLLEKENEILKSKVVLLEDALLTVMFSEVK